MDFIFEFIGELLIEGGLELGNNKKVSKWIRYPILGIIGLFFTILILGIFLLGIYLFKENILLGLFMIGVSIILLVGCINQLRAIKARVLKK